MQERRTNGTNYVGIKAPQSIAASLTFTMPGSDGQANDCLQTDGSGQWGWATCGSGVDVVTTDYDWSQTPGGSLTAATPATKTLTPCPDGVAPYSTHHNLRISGGTGTAETVLITAVSGSGSTCDITFTPANNHSGAWAIASASDGIQEAARMVTGAKRLFVPLGQQTMDAPAPGEETTVYIQQGITIAGAGNDPGTGSYVYAAGDQWAMIFDTIYPVHVSNLAVGSNGAQASGGGIKLTAGSTLQNCNSTFHDLQLSQLRTAMYLERGCIPFITNSMFSAYSYEGLRLENIDNPDAGDQTITGNYFQVVGAGGIGTTAIKWLSAGGARIISNKFNTQGGAIDLESNTNTIIASIVGNSFDNQTEFSVKVRAPSPDSFAFVNVSSNIFTGAGASGYKAIDIGDATDDIDNVAIIGNNMQGDGTAIRIGSADKVTIDGNTIGLYALGIQTTSAATQVALGQNTLYSLTTKYDISNDANVRPTAPLFVSGYSRSWSSGANVQAIAEFAEPSVGTTANNAVMFLNGSTGANTQRGIWWSYNTGDLNFARFGTAKTAAPTTDFLLQTDGDAQFNYNVGIGRDPSAGVALDVNGTIRSTDGTIILQSYVFGGAGYLGTETNHPVLVMQDNTVRVRLTGSALLPETLDAFNSGDATRRWLGTYSKIFDSVAVGGTGDYMQTRKLQLFDNTGSSTAASYWDLNVVMSGAGAGQNSYFYLRDNAGANVFKSERIASGSAVSRTTWYTSLLPDTDGGRDIGTPLLNWDKVYANQIGDASYPAVIWGANSDFTGLNTIALTINTGAATVGHVWTATSTGGAGSWQAISTALPVVDTTGIAKGSSDASKIVRFEVDGLTTGTTRVLTVQDGDHTLAGLNINQTFVNPQTIAIASVQNQMTLAQTNNSGFYDPACLVLASTDTVTSTIYGAARVCSGYESAAFTDEKFAIQTATGSGTYQDAITIKNQAVALPGALTVTGLTTFNGFVDMLGAGINYMYGTLAPQVNNSGSIGTVGSRYGDFFGVRGNFNAATITNNGPALGAGQNIAPLWVTGTSGFVSVGLYRTDDTNGGWLLGTSGVAVGDFAIYQNQGAGSPSRRFLIDTSGTVDIPGNLSAAVINATGSPAYRVSGTTVIDASRNATFVGLTTSGAVSLASSTITASSTFSSDLIATTGSTYALGSSGVRWLGYFNTVNINGTVTLNGSVTGDVLFTSNNTYLIGNGTNYLNNIHSETFTTYGRVKPASGVTTADLGAATTPFRKLWTGDISFTGTMTPPSGTAFSGTKTVRASGGASDCTLTFSAGIMTGGTC